MSSVLLATMGCMLSPQIMSVANWLYIRYQSLILLSPISVGLHCRRAKRNRRYPQSHWTRSVATLCTHILQSEKVQSCISMLKYLYWDTDYLPLNTWSCVHTHGTLFNSHMSPTGHKWLSSSPRTTSLSPSVHTSERGTCPSLQTRVSRGNPSTSTTIQRIISRTSLLSFYTPARESQLPRVYCLRSYRWWVESY